MIELFLKIVNMSISASWLILAVLIFRVVFKKAPSFVNMVLWSIVALRLFCNISIESVFSLIPSAETLNVGIVTGEKIDVQTGISPIDDIINGYTTASVNSGVNITNVLYVIWLIGILSFAIYAFVSYFRLKQNVDIAIRYKDNIYQSENVISPFVLGIIKPKIYLPYNLNEQDIKYIVAHEKAHIAHKDHWWKMFGFALLILHWFNPLVWLSYMLFCKDIELSCDEMVIKELNCMQRADYSQALVNCSTNRRSVAICPLAFGEIGVKERIKSIMNYRKPKFGIIAICIIVCIAFAICFLTNPKHDSYSLRIIVPAGSQDDFVYSDEMISPKGNYITVSNGNGLGDTTVALKAVDGEDKEIYSQTYLTPGMPVKMETQKGTCYKIGVNMQNNTDEDIIVYVDVENIDVLISCENQAINYYLTVRRVDVAYIEIHTPDSSGGVMRADEKSFVIGEQIWLEALDGAEDLQGLEIIGYNDNNEVIFTEAVDEKSTNFISENIIITTDSMR